MSLTLADTRGTFLFIIRPDVFPHGFLTDTELELWGLYYASKEARGV